MSRSDVADDPDAADATDPQPPAAAVEVVGGLAGSAIDVLSGLPGLVGGAASGLLAPFAALLGQFGEGAPALPPSTGLPIPVLNSLASLKPDVMAGAPAEAYRAELATERGRADAMNHLEHRLRGVLESSAANTALGRDRIEQVLAQVTATLRGLGPVADTPLGQVAVLSAIAAGLQQAGAVMTGAVGADALNADTVNAMAAQYLTDVAADRDRNPRAATSDGPQGWAIAALAANGITDRRAVANWLPGLMTMGERESGHNPRARNDWDSNAAKGTPSMGWMQTIGPTFQAHWRPGTSRDIFDPVANAAAAIHYVMQRYGVSPDGSDLMRKVQQANPDAAPKGY